MSDYKSLYVKTVQNETVEKRKNTLFGLLAINTAVEDYWWNDNP